LRTLRPYPSFLGGEEKREGGKRESFLPSFSFSFSLVSGEERRVRKGGRLPSRRSPSRPIKKKGGLSLRRRGGKRGERRREGPHFKHLEEGEREPKKGMDAFVSRSPSGGEKGRGRGGEKFSFFISWLAPDRGKEGRQAPCLLLPHAILVCMKARKEKEKKS